MIPIFLTGQLSVVASVIENADFDGDGDVDGRDFLAWQRGYGSAGTLSTGDANNDGFVNEVDLGIWQIQYNNAGLLATSHVVPEPAGLTLLLGIMGFFCRARHVRF